MLNIEKIKEGTVIDHIPSSEGLKLLPLLQLETHPGVVSLGLNLPSDRLGKKDLIKVEGRFFTPDEINRIALFAPEATISIIKNGAVAQKFQVALPQKIEGTFTCKNPRCVTRSEPVKTRFTIQRGSSNLNLNCDFCGAICQL